MKKQTSIKVLLLFISALAMILSCKKDGSSILDNENWLIAPKTEVKTYETVNLVSYNKLQDRYKATFGGVDVDLIKTSDTTLTLWIPNVNEGENLLTIGTKSIRFKVSKTAKVDNNNLISTILKDFDAQIVTLKASTPEDIEDVKNIRAYKDEVFRFINSLSEEQKNTMVLFYEANKGVVETFSTGIFSTFDAPTTLRSQSKCSRAEDLPFFDCTSETVNDGINQLDTYVTKMSKIAVATSVITGAVNIFSANLVIPVAIANPIIGAGILGAIYLFRVKGMPALKTFNKSLDSFLSSTWIPKVSVPTAITEFKDKVSSSLNIVAKIRALKNTDINIKPNINAFIEKMPSLKESWNKFNLNPFSKLSSFKDAEESFDLDNKTLKISNISNSKVRLVEQNGQSLKFESTSGKDETFNFKTIITKGGFVEEKTLSAKVTMDDIETLLLGKWKYTTFITNGVPYDASKPGNDPCAYNLTWTFKGNGELEEYYYCSIPNQVTQTAISKWQWIDKNAKKMLIVSKIWGAEVTILQLDNTTFKFLESNNQRDEEIFIFKRF
jgi:hypothetical protein